ncbi:hypothetical protein JAAARDRAFT_646349 [Jaapia argillacea MUCL 33604]|uniref:DUF6533 domain-containing protein n=1 Tax=Jaapia argillacea MUCL 33604 TaxID=933084 RepID=A0A067Q8E2_9AGAM|nr:hypothetical protein JAAARDRAFT_646349 [Jaapia argillacea MUCL 33604]
MQDFDPVAFVQNLQFLRLFQLSGTVVTIYDHSILFDREVELIWERPGIIAKIFFFLIRYCGDCIIITILIRILVSISVWPTLLIFSRLAFLTEVTSDSVSHSRFLLQIWATVIPVWTVQVIMQFRVYALYNRAKWVLALNLDVFHNPTCDVTHMPPDAVGPWISAMAFEGILFLLVLYKTVVHLLQLNYPLTRNSVTQVLLRDNIFYFVVVFSIYCLTVLAWYTFPIIWIEIFSNLNVAVTCILGSRLILNIRKASYRYEECVNTQEIEFQLRELVYGVERGAWVSGDDSLARGSHDNNGTEGEGESRQVV